MQISFRRLLPSVSKAPANPSSKCKNTTAQLKAKVACTVIEECLDQTNTNGFTSRTIFESVAEIKAAYKNPNALGTSLGTGIKGTGMGLHRKNSAFARCRENAVLAANCLSDDAFSQLASDLGYNSQDELAEAIAALPTI